MVDKYIILESQDDGVIERDSSLSVLGYAPTLAKAKLMIHEDAVDNFDPNGINGDFDDYCGHYLICSVYGEFQPVPSVKVSMLLKDIPDGN